MYPKNRVAQFRRARRMSQADLAASASITRTYVSNIERDVNTPTVDIAKRLCAALGATLDEVFNEKLSEVSDCDK